MSRWLPIHVRRIIAILLLLLDLGLEPGSALSFVGMSAPEDNEAVDDLCRQDDFWWGKASAAIDEAARAVTSANCGDGMREGATQFASAGSVLQAAFIPFTIENILAPEAWFEHASSAFALPAFDGHSLYGDSYIAQKRDIVLIV